MGLIIFLLVSIFTYLRTIKKDVRSKIKKEITQVSKDVWNTDKKINLLKHICSPATTMLHGNYKISVSLKAGSTCCEPFPLEISS